MLVRKRILRWAVVLAVGTLGFGLSGEGMLDSAYAQPNPATTATAAAYAEGFQPVPGGKPQTEEVNASVLVVSAYGAFALAFVGYLIHLGRQQARLAQEMVELSSRMDAAQNRQS